MKENRRDLEQPPHRSAEGAHRERTAPSSRLARRDFLQVGLLGVAGSLAGVGGVAEAAAAPPNDALPGAVPPRRQDEETVTAVVAGDRETWNEPWVWRPSDWPGQQLHLNVVENQNPGPSVGLGNEGAVLFSYGGDTPGPTIRMKGDETLCVKLRNLLAQDFGDTFVGPFPNGTPTNGQQPDTILDAAKAKAAALGNYRTDFCLGEHTNGVHAIRVTNLHTHGLHVRPSRNPNGTHSDNVILRVLSQADFRRREEEEGVESCRFLRDPDELYFVRDDEVVGEANYEFRLGNVQRRNRERENERRLRNNEPLLPPQPHPAGTFWYHPHAHGATHNQVASGMAGFLLVEGDIEDAVNKTLVGWKETDPVPDPSVKTGPYDYRERLMFFQRVLSGNVSVDKDARKREINLLKGAVALVNGGSTPTVIRMRPGAVERWRVLNGSVDGRGYKRFMVVKGQYVVRSVQVTSSIVVDKLYEVTLKEEDGALGGEIDRDNPFTLADLEALERTKQDLYQLSIDGVTLVKKENGQARYFIKALSTQGVKPGTTGESPDDMLPNPLWSYEPTCASQLSAQLGGSDETVQEGADLLCRLTNVWASKENVKNCFVRWNEFYMGPANRTDVFFQAPTTLSRTDPATGKQFEVYTVLAKTVLVHSDTPLRNAQLKVTGTPEGAPEDVVVAYVLVEEDSSETPIQRADMKTLMGALEKALPPVQPYLQPIEDHELVVTPEEVKKRSDVSKGDHRTRRILYSGWGHPSMPLATTYPLKLKSRRRRNDPPTARAFVDFINSDPMVSFKVEDPKTGEKQTITQRKHENLIYAEYPEGSGYYVAMAPELRTMALSVNNPRTAEERAKDAHPDDASFLHPDLPRKFDPTDPYRARMLEDTAEEWTLYNLTNTLFGNTTTARKSLDDPRRANNDPFSPDYKQPPTQYGSHYVALPISRERGQQQFFKDQNFQVVSRGIDHPFHVHQNPFWVTRIEIPDETGALVNILDEPRWMDSIWIPRNRGRVVLRMRFPDFVGAYVHHCHILLHEDNGMMHVIEATPFADQSNYYPQQKLDVDENAPRPTPEEAYRISYTFYDPDETTGQLYPGFEVTAPGPSY